MSGVDPTGRLRSVPNHRRSRVDPRPIAGGQRHPAWYHHLLADPEVTFGGVPMLATVVPAGSESEQVWSLADRVFPTFERYRREAAAAGRTIPIVQLARRS